MKVKALANLSTAQGRKTVGQEFVVSAADGQALIDRRLVQPVVDTVTSTEDAKTKTAKTKTTAKE